MPDVILESSPVLLPAQEQQLASLDNLLESGVLSQGGYEEAKRRLLSPPEPAPEPTHGPSGSSNVGSQGRPIVIGGAGGSSPHPSEVESDTGGPSPAEFKELFNLVVGFFPEAKGEPERAPHQSFIHDLKQREDPQSFCRFKLYDRLTRIKEDISAKVQSCAKEARKPSAVLNRRRASYKVSGEPPCFVPTLNDDFGRITKSKPSANAQMLVPLEEARRLEATLAGLEEA